MNCSPKTNSPDLLSPGEWCDCICCVTLTLDSLSAFMQKFQYFWEVPDLHLTLATQRTSGCTVSWIQVWGSPCRKVHALQIWHAATRQLFPLWLCKSVFFFQLSDAQTYTFANWRFGELPKNWLDCFGKSKIFCWAQAKTYFWHLGLKPEESIRPVLEASWGKSWFQYS